jgi:hypothetical protein
MKKKSVDFGLLYKKRFLEKMKKLERTGIILSILAAFCEKFLSLFFPVSNMLFFTICRAMCFLLALFSPPVMN